MMNGLLINGVYDSGTLGTLKDKGVKDFSFDLRGKSSNLITYRDLQDALKVLSGSEVFLVFENDKKETIVSFLNILRDQPVKFKLIFRDSLAPSFYRDLAVPFFWMYSPNGDWSGILRSKNCQGILLPLKYEPLYQSQPEFWALIDELNLDVYIHAETFEQTTFIKNISEIKLSIDLSSEVESAYRRVDQERLSGQRIWRRLNENSPR
jgi:hypothetical protein